MTLDTIAGISAPRYLNIKRLIDSFPRRTFILVGDTATGSTLSSYVRLAHEYPDSIQCILIRDVSATEPANWIVGNTAALHRLTGKYVIFSTPDELFDLTILLEGLSQGNTSNGCGGLQITNDFRWRGNAVSWMLTIGNGLSALYHCLFLLWARPHVACPLDRRERAWYHHGGFEPLHNTTEIITNLSQLPSQRPLFTRDPRPDWDGL